MNYKFSNEPISMLIVVSDNVYYKSFVSYLVSMHTIDTLGFAENISEIIPMALDLQTNIIIIDISLIGNLNDILMSLKNVRYKGSVIIITDEYNSPITTLQKEYDRVFYMKRLSSHEELAKQVVMVSKHSFNFRNSMNASVVKEDTDFEFPVDLYKEVTTVLLKCGFNTKHKGFIYIRESIMIKCLVRDSGSLSKNIYPYIAERYNVSSESVERAIRSAVSHVWNSSRLEYMGEQGIDYFYSTKPSNSVIINHITDIIKSKKCL